MARKIDVDGFKASETLEIVVNGVSYPVTKPKWGTLKAMSGLEKERNDGAITDLEYAEKVIATLTNIEADTLADLESQQVTGLMEQLMEFVAAGQEKNAESGAPEN
jgi:hypothetical protein